MAYRELQQQAPLIACLWERDPAATARELPVLPDACVDIVSVDGRLLVAGPATAPVTSRVPARAIVLGVRFRIGAAGAALGLPASELLDSTIPLDDLWGTEASRIAERVAAAPTPALQLTTLANELRNRTGESTPDPLARAVATAPNAPIHDLASTLGITDRQLRRRFATAVGYGPKTLQRVLRFQRFLALSRRAPSNLAQLAFEAGYADQAHLTREARRLAGRTPAELIAEGASPAGDRSVSFKTPVPRAASMAA